ncbi:MAG: Crp/Fnr family transcriptional regulator [Verrucomicrobiota bacterium]
MMDIQPETVTHPVLPPQGWLATLTDQERILFSSFGETIQLKQQQILIQEGQAQPYFFFITEGMLSVRRGDIVVAVVGSGEFLGEMTIVTNGAASATVTTLEACSVWRMSHEKLMKFIYEHHEIGIKLLLTLLSTVSERLQTVNSDLADLLAERRKQTQVS